MPLELGLRDPNNLYKLSSHVLFLSSSHQKPHLPPLLSYKKVSHPRAFAQALPSAWITRPSSHHHHVPPRTPPGLSKLEASELPEIHPLTSVHQPLTTWVRACFPASWTFLGAVTASAQAKVTKCTEQGLRASCFTVLLVWPPTCRWAEAPLQELAREFNRTKYQEKDQQALCPQ